MFVRFRKTAKRLQVSLAETGRIDGKVRHEHVASLGSIRQPQSIADRLEFWRRLYERLAKLGNRLTPEQQGKILGAVHMRIAMVTPDEQRALQLDNANADAKIWDAMAGMSEGRAAGNRELAATVEREAAEAEAAAKEASEHRAALQQRIDAIERGDTVSGGLGKPLDYEKILRDAGYSTADLRHMARLSTLDDTGFGEFIAEIGKGRRSRERAALSRVLNRRLKSKNTSAC